MNPSISSLTDKIILITGGGSGISLAFAILAHQQGAKVLIADLTLTHEAQAFISSSSSDGRKERIVFQKTDVTKWSAMDTCVGICKERWGDAPDIWVAGAGVFEPEWSNFWNDSEKDRYRTLDINISHPIKLTRIAIRSLLSSSSTSQLERTRKKGTVLLISSISGLRGNYGAPLYCASKFALVGFVRSLRELESREGIRVLAICPGLVKTPLWTSRPETMRNFGFPEQEDEVMEPKEVARAMVKLCVDEDKYEGGAVLEITKGEERVIPEWNVEAPKHAELGTGGGDRWGHVGMFLGKERERESKL